VGHIGYFAGVEMPREFSAWQTDDMHRHRPATHLSRWRRHQKSASTIIRPHSRYETERSERVQRRIARRLKRAAAKGRTIVAPRLRTSTRPILREELHQRFVERLGAAFKETVTW
jgi:hypothetical protein